MPLEGLLGGERLADYFDACATGSRIAVTAAILMLQGAVIDREKLRHALRRLKIALRAYR